MIFHLHWITLSMHCETKKKTSFCSLLSLRITSYDYIPLLCYHISCFCIKHYLCKFFLKFFHFHQLLLNTFVNMLGCLECDTETAIFYLRPTWLMYVEDVIKHSVLFSFHSLRLHCSAFWSQLEPPLPAVHCSAA